MRCLFTPCTLSGSEGRLTALTDGSGMPTIHREDGFEVLIYTNDHPPPHVHVFDADGECVIELGIENAPPEIREINGMRNRSVVRAYRIVQTHRNTFLKRWREIHGL